MPARLEARGAGDFAVHGELDFDSVATLWREFEREFNAQPPNRIDLGGVTRSDSSGVALLVEWWRLAKACEQPLEFSGVPAQMLAIVRVSDLEHVLPLRQNGEAR